jgi:hypothetical protein
LRDRNNQQIGHPGGKFGIIRQQSGLTKSTLQVIGRL